MIPLLLFLVSALALPVPEPQTITSHSGKASWYRPDGTSDCGLIESDPETMLVASLSAEMMASGDHCRERIMVNYKDKSVVATVIDTCVLCPGNNINLSPAAYQKLTGLDNTMIDVTWDFTYMPIFQD